MSPFSDVVEYQRFEGPCSHDLNFHRRGNFMSRKQKRESIFTSPLNANFLLVCINRHVTLKS
jgi:hypothetical protein